MSQHKRHGAQQLRFSSWDEAFASIREAECGSEVVEIAAPALGPGVYTVRPDGVAIRQLDDLEVWAFAARPRVPVGYRPLREGERAEEFDMVYDPLLLRWRELSAKDVADLRSGRFRDVFFANTAPLVRRIGESDGDNEPE